jgi:hypothetical protein
VFITVFSNGGDDAEGNLIRRRKSQAPHYVICEGVT